MKEYIYGAALVAVAAALAVFFFRPPETAYPKASTPLVITFQLPEDYEFTEKAPFVLTWRTESPEGMLSVPEVDRDFNPIVSPHQLILTPAPGSAALILNARLYFCHKTSRMCFQDDFEARVPFNPETLFASPWVWEITPKAGDTESASFFSQTFPSSKRHVFLDRDNP